MPIYWPGSIRCERPGIGETTSRCEPASGLFQEAGKFGGGPELRDRIKLLERRRKGIAQAPHRARLKLFVFRRVSADLPKIVGNHAIAGPLNGASPRRRPHFVSFEHVQSLHRQQWTPAQESLVEGHRLRAY